MYNNYHRTFPKLQVDRVYLGSSDDVAVLDHQKKRTYVIRKEGLPDVGKLLSFFYKKKLLHSVT